MIARRPNEKLTRLLAELRRRFEALYGSRLVSLVLFGSQARGDAEPGSDIDVLVVLKGPVSPGEEIERTLDDVAAVSLEYDTSAACIFVSHEEFQRERSPLMLNIRREGLPV